MKGLSNSKIKRVSYQEVDKSSRDDSSQGTNGGVIQNKSSILLGSHTNIDLQEICSRGSIDLQHCFWAAYPNRNVGKHTECPAFARNADKAKEAQRSKQQPSLAIEGRTKRDFEEASCGVNLNKTSLKRGSTKGWEWE